MWQTRHSRPMVKKYCLMPGFVGSLQDTYAPNSSCFGCGPKNEKGLRIKSWPEGDEVVCDWRPEPHHASFAGFLSGGIASTILDCHGNWTAAYALMKKRNLAYPPGTVTAEISVKFLKPTPIGLPLQIRARAKSVQGDRAYVECEILSAGAVTTTMNGHFVAVKEGHPAFHRWY
jgi:acyl-coenzyme A thioesterase PaaI-like protein